MENRLRKLTDHAEPNHIWFTFRLQKQIVRGLTHTPLVQIQTVCMWRASNPHCFHTFGHFWINRSEEWGQKSIGNHSEDFPHEHQSSMCPELLGHSSNTYLALVAWTIYSVWTKKTDANPSWLKWWGKSWFKRWLFVAQRLVETYLFIKIVCHLQLNWDQFHFSSWILI